eukprot:m.104278 g.104278  ORF g.104278 m.104278 type:complete len:207 (-) comp15233_c0_seq2:89-709(-)
MEGFKCSVCHKDLQSTVLSTNKQDSLILLKGCGHQLHKACFDSWFTRQRNCPQCSYQGHAFGIACTYSEIVVPMKCAAMSRRHFVDASSHHQDHAVDCVVRLQGSALVVEDRNDLSAIATIPLPIIKSFGVGKHRKVLLHTQFTMHELAFLRTVQFETGEQRKTFLNLINRTVHSVRASAPSAKAQDAASSRYRSRLNPSSMSKTG